ncbi:hypothetical protein ACGF13_36005 [Kitasatospora sp. NPDC048286]|uniref:hypothetical protein n=1 Tax=Kitasatospora sp. NPDC048286 TaxID=3364047 RepID=UPI00370FBB8D
MGARPGVTEEFLAKIESDDARSLELREVVMAFSVDVGASLIRTVTLLRRQAKHPIDELSHVLESSRTA